MTIRLVGPKFMPKVITYHSLDTNVRDIELPLLIDLVVADSIKFPQRDQRVKSYWVIVGAGVEANWKTKVYVFSASA